MRINPNGRIPAIVDHDNDNFSVWESGAILLYLVQTYDKNYALWSPDPKIQSQITSWLCFQVSGHSVMQGQAVYFKYFAREKSPAATARYINETRRVYGVLEMALAEQREMISNKDSQNTSPAPEIDGDDEDDKAVWLVDQRCTIADLSFLTWSKVADRVDIIVEEEYPEVSRWINNMINRRAVQRALIGCDDDNL